MEEISTDPEALGAKPETVNQHGAAEETKNHLGINALIQPIVWHTYIKNKYIRFFGHIYKNMNFNQCKKNFV